MTTQDKRRAEILDRLADHVLAEGVSASSLRPLAKAAQTSDRMLLYYFKNKADLMGAVLNHIAQRLVGILEQRGSKTPLPLEELQERLLQILLADNLLPYMRLWLEIAALAARGDPLYRALGENIARGFLAWGAAQLECTDETEREFEAARLLVSIEGTLLLKAVGLDDVCESAKRG